MKTFGTLLGCLAMAALAWTACTCGLPERAPIADWSPEGQRSRALDEQWERVQHFAQAICEIDQAVARDGLPLLEAAGRVVAAAERIDPAQLAILAVAECKGRDAVEKSAWQLVRRFRTEIEVYGNPAGLPPDLLDRLERELREMEMQKERPAISRPPAWCN